MARFKDVKVLRESGLAFKVRFEYNGQKVETWLPRSQATVKNGVLEVRNAFWSIKSKEVEYTLTRGAKSLKSQIAGFSDLKNAKAKYIEGLITGLQGEAKTLQANLYNKVIDKYLSKLQTKDGRVVFNQKNIATVNEMSAAVERFGTFNRTSLTNFAGELLSVSYIDSGTVLGISDSARLDKAIDSLDIMSSRIGATVTPEGAVSVIAGGPLDKLAGSTELADKIAKYATANIGSGAGYEAYVKGMGELVKGAVDAEGLAERYYRTYAYDSYSQASATADNYVAEQLDLNWFVYQGDEIDTTREFCSERVNGVYSREDGEKWNGQDWAGKIAGVDFFVQRGGYNCRHELDWISEEMAKEMGGEV